MLIIIIMPQICLMLVPNIVNITLPCVIFFIFTVAYNFEKV